MKPYIGPISEDYIREFDEATDTVTPGFEVPKLVIKKTHRLVEQLTVELPVDQPYLQKWLSHMKINGDFRDTPRIYLAFFTADALENLSQVNLPIFLKNVESVIERNKEIVHQACEDDFLTLAYQHVLETISNVICSGNLDPKKFVPFMGPRSKAYIQEWDQFTKILTPGFEPARTKK